MSGEWKPQSVTLSEDEDRRGCGQNLLLPPKIDTIQPVNVKEYKGTVTIFIPLFVQTVLNVFWIAGILHYAYLDSKQKAGGENSEISSCYEDTIYKNQSLCESYAHCECEWETEDGGYCDGIWAAHEKGCELELDSGVDPTKILALGQVTLNVVMLIVIPPYSAMIDLTNKRKFTWKMVLYASALCNVGIAVVGAGGLWIVSLVFMHCQTGLYDLQWIINSAYLAELSPSDVIRAAAAGTRQTLGLTSAVFAVILVIGLGMFVTATNHKTAARGLHVTAAVYNGLVLATGSTICLKLFGERKASTEKVNKDGRNLFMYAFSELLQTFKKLNSKYNQAGRFLICRFFHSGVDTFLPLMFSYVVTALSLESMEVGLVGLVMLVAGALGGLTVQPLVGRFGIKPVLMAILLSWTVFLVVFPLFVYSSDHRGPRLWILGSCPGVLFASLSATDIAAFTSMTAAGHENEFSGLFVWTGYLIKWAPPLVYSATSDRLGIALIAPYPLLSFIILGLFVDIEDGKRQVGDRFGLEKSTSSNFTRQETKETDRRSSRFNVWNRVGESRAFLPSQSSKESAAVK